MRRYDTTFILNPQIGDDRIDATVKTVTSIITNGKGEVLRENRMGSRRMAYDIARQSHGYYVCLIHESDSGVISELDRHFTLADDCLRHLTIRFEGDPHRKNMSEVMMGFEAEKREADEERAERRSAPAEATAPVATAAAVEAAPAESAEATTSTETAEEPAAPKAGDGETL